MKNKRTNLRANASTSRQPNRATGTLIRPRPKEAPFGIRKVFATAALHGETLPAEIFSKKFVGFQALAASI